MQFQVVREIHDHHEQKRNELRERHGSLYEDFENVHTQLNHLSNELHLLSDHGVSLDANFSKFGYDAHLSKAKFVVSCFLFLTRISNRNERL